LRRCNGKALPHPGRRRRAEAAGRRGPRGGRAGQGRGWLGFRGRPRSPPAAPPTDGRRGSGTRPARCPPGPTARHDRARGKARLQPAANAGRSRAPRRAGPRAEALAEVVRADRPRQPPQRPLIAITIAPTGPSGPPCSHRQRPSPMRMRRGSSPMTPKKPEPPTGSVASARRQAAATSVESAHPGDGRERRSIPTREPALVAGWWPKVPFGSARCLTRRPDLPARSAARWPAPRRGGRTHPRLPVG
jgi:hypothetical protein